MKPPISDPFAPPDSFCGEETRVFRHSFWRVYRGMLLMIIVLFSPFLFFIFDPIHGESLFHKILFIWIVLPCCLTFMQAFSPVKINRSGIQIAASQDFAEWSQIKGASYSWMFLLYVRIWVQGRLFKQSLPLTLRDPKGFARAIEEWAPVDNPLRLWLQKRDF